MDTLSIIIPAYNRASQLERTLESVKAQTCRPFEIIIVDNNSSDGTLEVARRWKELNETADMKVTVAEENKPGACAARNRGASIASGTIFAFFDSDDTMRPNYAHHIMEAFSNNPEAELVYWRKAVHTVDGQELHPRFAKNDQLYNHLFHAIFATQTMAMHRSLLDRAGGWNVTLPVWNDWELGLRLSVTLASPAVPIDNVLVDVYAQAESITGLSFIAKRGLWEQSIETAARRIAHMPGVETRLFLNGLAMKMAILAGHYWREGDPVAGKETLRRAISLSDNHTRTKLLLETAYMQTRHHIRGAARLLYPML